MPARGIIGPWGHIYPHDGVPGPAIGYLQEAVRWWDQWLKGRDTGVMEEPRLRAYVQDSVPPETTRSLSSGRWAGLAEWPWPEMRPLTLHLGADGGLGLAPGPDGMRKICSPESHGRAGGEWMGAGVAGEHPGDQRLDDGGALLFETAPLDEALPVLGAPRLSLDLAADVPVAHVVARLSDVAPDGRVTRVSYQVLNLTHLDSHSDPTPLESGRFYPVEITLNDCGYRFLPGHRIRIALATTYWPMIWPAPRHATLTFRTAGCCLVLPVLPADRPEPAMFPPAHGPRTPITQLDPGSVRRYSMQDHVTGEQTYVTDGVGGVFGEGVLRFDDIGTEVGHSLKRELVIRDDDPLSARYVLRQTFEMGREGWRTRSEIRTAMHSDATHFHLSGELDAFENGEHVARREWRKAIPRDLL